MVKGSFPVMGMALRRRVRLGKFLAYFTLSEYIFDISVHGDLPVSQLQKPVEVAILGDARNLMLFENGIYMSRQEHIGGGRVSG